MQDFTNKVAVVTGAGSGIGRALAVRFAAEGMRVALGDIDPAGMVGTVAEINAATSGAVTLCVNLDVRHAADQLAFADEVFAAFGQVDVLCNNAGVFVGGYLWDRPVEELALVIDVNVWGMLHGIQAFVPRMIAQGTEGHVVNTASVAGLFGSPFAGPYNVSKFAAFAVAESLADDLLASGSKLRASVLCPGAINTNIAKDAQDRPAREGVAERADQQLVTDFLVDLVDRGKAPEHVADCVIDAIRAERFLILTHEEHADFILARAQELAGRQLPTLPNYS